MKLITLSGLDGSGKSTQVQLLKNYLQNQKEKVFYFHAIDFSLATKIKNFLSFKKKHSTQARAIVRANIFQIMLRKFFLVIDALRFHFLALRLANKGFTYILTDRYFFDQVINIFYLDKKKLLREKKSFFLKITKNLLKKPDLALYLKTTPALIFQRDRMIEQGMDYLEEKNALYDHFFEVWKLININGDQSREEIHKEIIKLVKLIKK